MCCLNAKVISSIWSPRAGKISVFRICLLFFNLWTFSQLPLIKLNCFLLHCYKHHETQDKYQQHAIDKLYNIPKAKYLNMNAKLDNWFLDLNNKFFDNFKWANKNIQSPTLQLFFSQNWYFAAPTHFFCEHVEGTTHEDDLQQMENKPLHSIWKGPTFSCNSLDSIWTSLDSSTMA